MKKVQFQISNVKCYQKASIASRIVIFHYYETILAWPSGARSVKGGGGVIFTWMVPLQTIL